MRSRPLCMYLRVSYPKIQPSASDNFACFSSSFLSAQLQNLCQMVKQEHLRRRRIVNRLILSVLSLPKLCIHADFNPCLRGDAVRLSIRAELCGERKVRLLWLAVLCLFIEHQTFSRKGCSAGAPFYLIRRFSLKCDTRLSYYAQECLCCKNPPAHAGAGGY